MHDAFDKYASRFGKQVKCKLQEIRAKTISNEPSLGLCSQQQQLLEEFDDEAFCVETTDIKRTSRYHIEDALKVHQGDTVMMYFRINADNIKKKKLSRQATPCSGYAA